MTALDDHAKAIGYVCVSWTELERILEGVATHLLGLKIASDEARCVFANVDFRSLVEIVKALSALKPVSEAWFEAMERLLNSVDNVLRPRRNRVVHDWWHVHEDGVISRMHVRTKLKKDQSFKVKRLTTAEIADVPKEEVELIASEISGACGQALRLAGQIPKWAEFMARKTD
jgi:hypothetical protein